jgi:peptidoglycan lytic transglycosylase
LSGKHADSRPAPRGFSTRTVNIANILPRRYVPLVASLALAGVVLGASVAAMTLGPATDAPTPTALGASAAPSSPAASRTGDERASRSGLRADADPSPSASPSPSSAKPASPKAKPSQPSGGGTVTNSGQCGASYYSGGTMANGQPLNPDAFTVAHKTLPFNTRVRLTNVANGKSVTAIVTDRGPYVAGRCFDLTPAAFKAIASLSAGVITVKYEVLS